MASRHQAREMAFQLVYEWSLNSDFVFDESRAREYWKERSLEDYENLAFFERVLKGVSFHLPQIDLQLEKGLENWTLKRVDKVDLAILRLAVFEMLYDTDSDKPDNPVVIDEAVELAKRFASKDSPSFVNGVLDKISKQKG
jgi:N utilization substance protein B